MSDFSSVHSAEPFSFCKFPKALLKGQYKNLSAEAKLLYALLLERRSLSVKNNWKDDDNQVYIFFTHKETMDVLNCCAEKATNVLAELDEKNGVGLIKRTMRGQGQAAMIYVKDIEIAASDANNSHIENKPAVALDPRLRKNRSLDFGKTEASKIDKNKTENHDVLSIKLPQQLHGNEEDLTQQSSEIAPIEEERIPLPSPPKMPAPNKTIQRNQKTAQASERSYSEFLSQSDRPQIIPETTLMTRRRDRDAYRRQIEQNIDYERLMACDESLFVNPQETRLFDNLFEIMVDVVCSTKPTVRVNQEDMPTSVVQDRFLKIREQHVQYVINAIQGNTTPIKNIRSYLITALYNSVSTLEQYNAAQDLYFRHWYHENFGHLPNVERMA